MQKSSLYLHSLLQNQIVHKTNSHLNLSQNLSHLSSLVNLKIHLNFQIGTATSLCLCFKNNALLLVRALRLRSTTHLLGPQWRHSNQSITQWDSRIWVMVLVMTIRTSMNSAFWVMATRSWVMMNMMMKKNMRRRLKKLRTLTCMSLWSVGSESWWGLRTFQQLEWCRDTWRNYAVRKASCFLHRLRWGFVCSIWIS